MATCDYTIDGHPDGPTVVFIHGWPDNASLWRAQVEALGADHRCVLVTLPNFGAQAVRAGGFDFPELIERLAATVREVQPGGQVSLVTHDWGAYCSYLLEKTHPELIEKLVAMDVGGHVERSGLKTSAMIMGYQWSLIGAWLVGGLVPPLGNLLSRGVAKVIRVPDRQRAGIRSRYNYPYFYLWRALLLPWKRGQLIGHYRPSCPVLYLYGQRKPFMFHSKKWLDIVAATGGRSEGVDGGHWFMETHPEPVNQAIRDFLHG